MSIKFFRLVGQIFLLWVIYHLSTLAVTLLHLPVPGAVLGMIVLFILLATGIVREEWLTAAATPLLKHLSFFFIPIAVGLMEWGDLFFGQGHLLFLPLVVSAIVALLVTGGMIQFLLSGRRRKEGEN